MFVKKMCQSRQIWRKKILKLPYLDNGYQSCQIWRKEILKLPYLDNRFQEVAKMQQDS